ncbi:MAG: protein translocase subunit SecD [Intrasporangium sp.]|uniref:protein translocase subunit SecD n=1 Tax=Intrasporangium sp. TaxID=1925024 RepID=UPI00264A4A9F|nr:protein translocase subunit SecD [Intrasporangium sp.]MDN5796935.1 protein translocase subunit SecD [Intrasporangium sp.]
MARSSEKRSATRSLTALLAILIGLAAITAGLAQWGGGQYSPRLGLDLEGGTEIILEPVLTGGQKVTPGQINQAVDIIRQRIDANGVAEAEISTLGGNNIDIAIPGTPTPEQLEAIRKPSQLTFRAVFVQTANVPTTAPAPQGTAPAPAATGKASDTGKASSPAPTPAATRTAANAPVPSALRAATSSPTATSTATPAAPTATAPPAPADQPAQNAAQDEKAIAAQTSVGLVGLGWDKKKADAAATVVAKKFVALDCSVSGALDKVVDDPDLPMATCSDDKTSKFVLGPVEIAGSEIADASSGFQTGPNGQPTSIVEVRLSFNAEGAKTFADVTRRLYGLKDQPPRDQFAVVLDKSVITAPRAQAVITNGQASITGNFTVDSAKQLAQQLKFGALPLSFKLQTQNDITPQLGQEQLTLGLLAGLLGMLLVVIYSVFQYRALAFVTVLSLVVAAVMTYLAVTILGTTHGFRLTMAGVTGLIVAIGVTADSFIVYFERIRDEVREGRPLVAAVETGWKRAKRTIIAADAVNFIAAVVLYVLASANVRGFAFTLGLTTIIDLVVVMIFTHPMVQLLARTEFFGNGHKWSGLDPVRLGAKVSPRYRGAGQFGTGPRPATRATTTAPGLRSADGRGQA